MIEPGAFGNNIVGSAATGTLISGLAGGLVGLDGSANLNIDTSSASVLIVSGATGGGLIGQTDGTITITRSFSTGVMIAIPGLGTSGAGVGGLVGYWDSVLFSSGTTAVPNGQISNSYSQMSFFTNTRGNLSAGGLAGSIMRQYGDPIVTLADDYFAGQIVDTIHGVQPAPTFPVGGLVGAVSSAAGTLSDGSITNSYWDTLLSATSVTIGGGGGQGLTTQQMFSQANYAGWGFGQTWLAPSSMLYPTLLSSLFPVSLTSVNMPAIAWPAFPVLDLHDNTLNGVDMSGLNASGTDFHGSFLPASDFSRATLRGTNLSGANLQCTLFLNADLTNANLSNADLTHVNLSNAILSGTNLSGALYDSGTQLPPGVTPSSLGMVVSPNPFTGTCPQE